MAERFAVEYQTCNGSSSLRICDSVSSNREIIKLERDPNPMELLDQIIKP
jgi:predicted O-methyltransferase YrrM